MYTKKISDFNIFYWVTSDSCMFIQIIYLVFNIYPAKLIYLNIHQLQVGENYW